MFDGTKSDFVPVLIEYRIGTLGGQDIAVVLQLTTSPAALAAGQTHEIIFAMTPEQAHKLGAGLITSSNAIELKPAANDIVL